MSAEDSLNAAIERVAENDFAGALEHFDAAIALDSSKGSYYAQRALCHVKLGRWSAAIADADLCLARAPNTHSALLQKGIAQFHSADFKGAEVSLREAARLGNKQTDLWLRKAQAELALDAKQTAAAGAATAASTSATPSASASASKAAAPSSSSSTDNPTPSASASASPAASAPVPAPPATQADKTRIQWFQSRGDVTLTALVKGLASKDVDTKLEAQSVSVTLRLSDGSVFARTYRLYGLIDPARSVVDLNPYKLEITMKKAVDADWLTYEASAAASILPANAVIRPNTIATASSSSTDTAAGGSSTTDGGAASASASASRSYPTSSAKKKGVDWEVEEQRAKKDEEDEKVDGEAALHKLFQKIYANATDETRRAMVKSYQTSGGTVLSTNWKEVAAKDYERERTPPKGQEFRDWGK